MRKEARVFAVVLGMLSAPLLAAGKGKVESLTGDVVITQGKAWLTITVDTGQDGSVDHVYGYQLQQEQGGKRAAIKEPVRLVDASVEYWGDRLIVTSEAMSFALDLAIVGSTTPQREFPSSWTVARLKDGYGLAKAISKTKGGSIRKEEYDPFFFWDPWADPPGGGDGGHNPACQSGGRHSSTCTITCGVDPVSQTATVVCGGASYACCWCDYTRAFAVCRSYGP